MIRLLAAFSSNLIVRSAGYYLLLVSSIIAGTLLLSESLGISEKVLKTIFQLCFAYAFPVLAFAWMIGPVARQDRRIMLIRILWMYGPLVIIGLPLVFVFQRFVWRTGTFLGDLLLIAVFALVCAVWQAISSPLARSWALHRASDPPKIMLAEARVHYPSTPKEIKEGEICIAPELYYGFISVLAAFVLIVADTILGEFLDNSSMLPGYLGAVVVALIVAFVMYPIHLRISRFVSVGQPESSKTTAKGLRSIMPKAVRALGKGFRAFFIGHPIVAFMTVVFATVFGWLAILYLPGLLM